MGNGRSLTIVMLGTLMRRRYGDVLRWCTLPSSSNVRRSARQRKW